ncbi:MAG: zf-HC2 domain-containing protein [Deltaproteobacteria bacterium]|nr:zf-HC2 domain-containing protein [Deltaproteobacteria bacterium]
MLSCREITELVTAYLERAMPREQQLAFLKHMRECRVCWHYLRQVRATARALGRAPAAPPPAEVKAALLAQFRSWTPGVKKE